MSAKEHNFLKRMKEKSSVDGLFSANTILNKIKMKQLLKYNINTYFITHGKVLNRHY